MKLLRIAACLAALLAAGASHAQTYPDGNVRVVVPYPAGGPTDVMARLVAQKLSEKLGEQFYIENVAGRLACQRFLDALETKDIPEEPLGYAVGPVTNLKTALRKKLRPLKRAFKEKRVNSRLWTKESARRKRDHALRSDVLDKTEMGEFLKAAQRFTGSFRDIQIVELEKNLLCLFR